MDRTINSLIESSRQWMKMAKFWYAALAYYLLVLGFLSLNPWVRPASRGDVFSPDKIEHALAYGCLAIIVFFCLTKSHNRYIYNTSRAWIAAMFISAFIGVFLEVAQSLFTYNRTGSVEDAAVNTIGASLGYAAYLSVKYIRTKMAV